MHSCIYVVDDEPAIGRLSSLILGMEGYVVESYTSSLEALNELTTAETLKPAVIVLDLNMPEMDGLEFFRRIRELGFKVPVLILSAYGAEAAQRELGAEAFVSKPFEPGELITKVNSLVAAG